MPAWALLVLALTVVVAASAGTIAWRSRRGSPPELRATPLGTTGPVAGVTSPVPAAVAGAPATAPPVRPAPTPPAPPTVTSTGATATPATTTPTTAAQTTPAVVPPPRTQAAPPVKQGSAPRSPRSPGGRAGAPASSPTAPLAPATPPPGTPPATGAAGDNEPASTATLIAQIEARLRALRAAKQSSGVDPLALQLLRDLRNRAATASTADDRRAIARDLREWQARYGSRGR